MFPDTYAGAPTQDQLPSFMPAGPLIPPRRATRPPMPGDQRAQGPTAVPMPATGPGVAVDMDAPATRALVAQVMTPRISTPGQPPMPTDQQPFQPAAPRYDTSQMVAYAPPPAQPDVSNSGAAVAPPAGLQPGQPFPVGPDGKPVLPTGPDGQLDAAALMRQLPAVVPPGAGKLAAPPVDQPPGAAKGLQAPPPSGMSPVGQAAFGDTRLWAEFLKNKAQELTPPASPMETWLRNGPPSIMVNYGGNGPGGWVQGPSTRSYASVGGSGSASGRAGPGGLAQGQSQWQQGSETSTPGQPVWSGPQYQTPFGPMGQLPNADMLQYGREQEGRQNALAALMEGAKGFGPAYQGQAAMVDAQARMAAEYGPMRQANEIGNATFAQTLQKTNDFEAANRARQQAVANFMAMNPGPVPGLGPQQPVSPEQALAQKMPGAQQAAPNPGQAFADMHMPQVGGFTDEGVRALLQQAGVLSPEGKLKDQNLDAAKLAETLANNPQYLQRGLAGLARNLLDAGLPPDKVRDAIDRQMIRYLNEATYGGQLSVISGKGHGGVTPAAMPPMTAGPYSIQPTASPKSWAGNDPTAPKYLTGYTVQGGAEPRWYPAGGLFQSGFGDVIPTVRESTKKDYRARASGLGAFRAAIEAELARRSAQAGPTPGR